MVNEPVLFVYPAAVFTLEIAFQGFRIPIFFSLIAFLNQVMNGAFPFPELLDRFYQMPLIGCAVERITGLYFKGDALLTDHSFDKQINGSRRSQAD